MVAAMDDDQQGSYSDLFYLMLIVGIIGAVGFVFVAAGSGG